jgi:hypothetical protein
LVPPGTSRYRMRTHSLICSRRVGDGEEGVLGGHHHADLGDAKEDEETEDREETVPDAEEGEEMEHREETTRDSRVEESGAQT